jgi:DNA modification methylase
VSSFVVLNADARSIPLADRSVSCVVTSPPYFGLRDYGVAGQIGLEQTPDAYVDSMVSVFREVWRVLRDDGTLWLNIGDSYASAWACNRRNVVGNGSLENGKRDARPNRLVGGLKEKDLIGIPWMLAFALRADGWYLRTDIIWHKPNPMPESVTDRPTRDHEYLFLLSKSARYYYDQEATLEAVSPNTHARISQNVAAQIGSDRANAGGKTNGNMKAVVRGGVNPKAAANAIGNKQNESFSAAVCLPVTKRNKRTVWTVTTRGFSDAHFATFPPALIEPCILAGSPMGGVVFDPFTGSGTTGEVAIRHGRNFVGTELNPDYCKMARKRIGDAPLSLGVA